MNKSDNKWERRAQNIVLALVLAMLLFSMCACAGMPPSQKILVNRMIKTADVLDDVPVRTETGEWIIPDAQEDGVGRLLKQNAETARQLRGYLEGSNDNSE